MFARSHSNAEVWARIVSPITLLFYALCYLSDVCYKRTNKWSRIIIKLTRMWELIFAVVFNIPIHTKGYNLLAYIHTVSVFALGHQLACTFTLISHRTVSLLLAFVPQDTS